MVDAASVLDDRMEKFPHTKVTSVILITFVLVMLPNLLDPVSH